MLLPLVPLAANPKQDPTDPPSLMAFLIKYKSRGTTIQTPRLDLPTPEARQVIVLLGVSAILAGIPATITTTITLVIIRGNMLSKVMHKKNSPTRITYRKDPYSSRSRMDPRLTYFACAFSTQGVPQLLSTRDQLLPQSSRSWETPKPSPQHKARTNQENILWQNNYFFPNFCKTRTIPSTKVRMFDIPNSPCKTGAIK